MTNELGTTLQDIEAKAKRRRDAVECLVAISAIISRDDALGNYYYETIRKYIEEN